VKFDKIAEVEYDDVGINENIKQFAHEIGLN
jgi:hypothetical protein